MAYITADHAHASERSGFWATWIEKFERYGHRRSRRDQVEALQAKSDDELAKMGIQRDLIVQYVFRDVFVI